MREGEAELCIKREKKVDIKGGREWKGGGRKTKRKARKTKKEEKIKVKSEDRDNEGGGCV